MVLREDYSIFASFIQGQGPCAQRVCDQPFPAGGRCDSSFEQGRLSSHLWPSGREPIEGRSAVGPAGVRSPNRPHEQSVPNCYSRAESMAEARSWSASPRTLPRFPATLFVIYSMSGPGRVDDGVRFSRLATCLQAYTTSLRITCEQQILVRSPKAFRCLSRMGWTDYASGTRSANRARCLWLSRVHCSNLPRPSNRATAKARQVGWPQALQFPPASRR